MNSAFDAFTSADLLDPDALLFGIAAVLMLWLIERFARGRPGALRLSSGRQGLVTTLRILTVLGLTLSIAGLALVRRDRSVSVIFCLDRSASMDGARVGWALDWIRDAAATAGQEDRAGLVAFAAEASLEQPLSPRLEPGDPATPHDRSHTSFAAALRLALAHFPGSTRRKIVLLSDGQDNLGDTLRQAAIARAGGVPVTTVLCEVKERPSEVLIESLDAPDRVEPNTPFTLRVNILTGQARSARLQLERGVEHSLTLPVTLQAGRTVVELPQTLERPDWHRYKLTIEAEDDVDPRNNVARALVEVRGRSHVLMVDRSPEALRPLAKILEQAGLEVTLGGASALPVSRAELARYDAVVVSDLPATAWSGAQLDAIADYVRELGGGFAMLGGPESFGLGGYFKTPIEEILPVDCDLRNNDDAPGMSLVFVLDRSGSMGGRSGGLTNIELAKEGVRRTLELLYDKDELGIIGFDNEVEWALPLTAGPKRGAVERALERLSPRGGTDICPGLVEAHAALAASPNELRHMVLLTDGQSAPGDFDLVLRDCLRDGISISSVGIGDTVDKALLAAIARRAGGRLFLASNASELPRIFTKDALTATRSLLVERRFVPRRRAAVRLLERLADQPLPGLDGFVLTSLKDDAELLLASAPGRTEGQNGPILARRRVGLGKSLAFTSDLKGIWSRDWLAWPEFPALWTRAIMDLRRDRGDDSLDVSVRWEQGEGRIVVEQRRPTEDLAAEAPQLFARIVPPPGARALTSTRRAPIRLEQVGFGRFEGRFPARRPGIWFVTVGEMVDGVERVRSTRGRVRPYPREYRVTGSRPERLRRIAELTGGRALALGAPPTGVFEHSGRPPRRSREVWPTLIGLVAALFVLDIAARRLQLRGLFAGRRARPRTSDDALLERLMDRKSELKKQLGEERQGRRSARLEAAADGTPGLARPAPRAPVATAGSTSSTPGKTAAAGAPKTPEPSGPTALSAPGGSESPVRAPSPAPKPAARADDGSDDEEDYTFRLLAAKRRARGKDS